MKTSTLIAGAIVAAVVVAGAFYFLDVDQTREAKLPEVEVDVNVTEGQTPKFKVETGSVDVGTTEKTVLVPKVVMEEETVTVPTVSVEPAPE